VVMGSTAKLRPWVGLVSLGYGLIVNVCLFSCPDSRCCRPCVYMYACCDCGAVYSLGHPQGSDLGKPGITQANKLSSDLNFANTINNLFSQKNTKKLSSNSYIFHLSDCNFLTRMLYKNTC